MPKEGLEGWITKDEDAFVGDGYVYYLDCGDDFIGIYKSQKYPVVHFLYNLLCVNCASVRWLKNLPFNPVSRQGR